MVIESSWSLKRPIQEMLAEEKAATHCDPEEMGSEGEEEEEEEEEEGPTPVALGEDEKQCFVSKGVGDGEPLGTTDANPHTMLARAWQEHALSLGSDADKKRPMNDRGSVRDPDKEAGAGEENGDVTGPSAPATAPAPAPILTPTPAPATAWPLPRAMIPMA